MIQGQEMEDSWCSSLSHYVAIPLGLFLDMKTTPDLGLMLMVSSPAPQTGVAISPGHHHGCFGGPYFSAELAAGSTELCFSILRCWAEVRGWDTPRALLLQHCVCNYPRPLEKFHGCSGVKQFGTTSPAKPGRGSRGRADHLASAKRSS